MRATETVAAAALIIGSQRLVESHGFVAGCLLTAAALVLGWWATTSERAS